MKIILTGATGFVGGEILDRMLVHPEVSRITALVRRPLAITHAKLDARIHRDFSVYPVDLVAELADHGACIWALGGKASEFDSVAAYARATHDFTLAFANAMASRPRPFTFCYLSGMGAAPSGSVRLPWEKNTRLVKGWTENDLASLSQAQPTFSAIAFRPGGVLPRTGSRWAEILFRPWVVRVGVLARAMIDAALHDASPRTIVNRQIRAWPPARGEVC